MALPGLFGQEWEYNLSPRDAKPIRTIKTITTLLIQAVAFAVSRKRGKIDLVSINEIYMQRPSGNYWFERAYRWVPLYSNVFNPISHLIQSLLQPHFLSPQCSSACLVQISIDSKEFYLAWVFELRGRDNNNDNNDDDMNDGSVFRLGRFSDARPKKLENWEWSQMPLFCLLQGCSNFKLRAFAFLTFSMARPKLLPQEICAKIWTSRWPLHSRNVLQMHSLFERTLEQCASEHEKICLEEPQICLGRLRGSIGQMCGEFGQTNSEERTSLPGFLCLRRKVMTLDFWWVTSQMMGY